MPGTVLGTSYVFSHTKPCGVQCTLKVIINPIFIERGRCSEFFIK